MGDSRFPRRVTVVLPLERLELEPGRAYVLCVLNADTPALRPHGDDPTELRFDDPGAAGGLRRGAARAGRCAVTTSTARGGETFHETRRTRAGDFLADIRLPRLLRRLGHLPRAGLAVLPDRATTSSCCCARRRSSASRPSAPRSSSCSASSTSPSARRWAWRGRCGGLPDRGRGRSLARHPRRRVGRPRGRRWPTGSWSPSSASRRSWPPSACSASSSASASCSPRVTASSGPQLDPIDWLAQGYVGPIPIPVIILFVGYAIAWVVLNRTPVRHPHLPDRRQPRGGLPGRHQRQPHPSRRSSSSPACWPGWAA